MHFQNIIIVNVLKLVFFSPITMRYLVRNYGQKMTTPATEEKRKKFELINMFVTTISVIVMGSINIYVTYSQNNDRLEFDRQNAQSILSMQNKELFSKDTEAVKQSELDFLKMGYEECQKDGELSFKRISTGSNWPT